MSNKVYTVETVELQNGEEVELRPLNIKALREFMVKMEEFGKAETEDQSLDSLISAAGVCLKGKMPDLVKDRDALEEALDLPTVYKIIDVCGGIKLNDPNQLAAAMAELGKN